MDDISDCLKKFTGIITQRLTNVKIFPKRSGIDNRFTALIVNREESTVKIEPNLIVRGCVFPTERRELCLNAQKLFERSITINTLSLADLYGSKICAALDRQHPRDLFDVHLLLKNEGITKQIRKAFLVYLISHPRPIVELLDPNLQAMTQVFEQEFRGMTLEQVRLKELVETQNYLRQNIRQILTPEERQFLISFKALEPNWKLLGMENVAQLPAVRWKLLNLQKMSQTKHQQALKKLTSCLIDLPSPAASTIKKY